MDLKYNEYQTPLTEELLAKYPKEVVNELFDYINNTPLIQRMISPDRPRAKDLPRDERGRIIVDVCNPHILEDMDYFRPSAIHYQKHGVFTNIKPDMRPKSPFQRWLRQEMWRSWYGMVRPEDGEWVTGPLYYYLNYMSILQTKIIKGKKVGTRSVDFPEMWEAVYLRFHYWYQARYGGLYNDFKGGQHAVEVASRGKSKSYSVASLMARNFILGTSLDHRTFVKTSIIADNKEYLVKDGTINKFVDALTFAQKNTQFPTHTIKSNLTEFNWVAGYSDRSGMDMGSQNTVMGIPLDGDSDKPRGKRVDTQIFEEFGSFANFVSTWIVGTPNVSEGTYAFGQNIAIGTQGESELGFSGAREFVKNPEGYNVYSIPNFYDKGSSGKQNSIFFTPSYMNAKGFYNKDGVSDVTGAMLDELMRCYVMKYNTSEPQKLAIHKAQYSFTLRDALVSHLGAIYNTAVINDRINEIDLNPGLTSDMMEGVMSIVGGEVVFNPSADVKALHSFPHKDNKQEGAILISVLPDKDSKGNVPSGRYIAGIDTFDDDSSETSSLLSCIILDLFTDRIVAEYTGRMDSANHTYERARLLLMFYNAEANYENNKKGLFAYFAQQSSLYLLSDTLDYLRDKEESTQSISNKTKGTYASAGVKMYGRRMIRDYLNKGVEVEVPNSYDEETGEYQHITAPMASTIKFRALLQELSQFNLTGNFDRHDALVMLMLLREDKLRLYGGEEITGFSDEEVEDDFFAFNYAKDKRNEAIISSSANAAKRIKLGEDGKLIVNKKRVYEDDFGLDEIYRLRKSRTFNPHGIDFGDSDN